MAFDEGHQRRLKENSGRLLGFAFALTRDRDTASDLLQESVVRAISAPSLPRDERAFRAWMFTTMRNLWIDRLRSPQERTEAFSPEQELVCAPLSMESLLVNKIAVRQAFELLSTEHREVLALVDIGGFSYEEAAGMLGIPMGTVMSRVSRARRALAAQLNENTITAMPVASQKVRNE